MGIIMNLPSGAIMRRGLRRNNWKVFGHLDGDVQVLIAHLSLGELCAGLFWLETLIQF